MGGKLRERRCAATGEVKPEAALLRFAVGPDGSLVPDAAAKLPGRGAWVSASRVAVEEARKRGGFQRSLKGPARAEADLADLAEAALVRRCLEALGLMRRAGALALGFDMVEAALRAGRGRALIEASDGADDGREKLLRLAPEGRVHLTGCFSAAELGMALGRDRVIHCAVLQERMAQRWTAEMGRLAGFRAIVPDSWPWRTLSPWTGELARSDAVAAKTATASNETDLGE